MYSSCYMNINDYSNITLQAVCSNLTNLLWKLTWSKPLNVISELFEVLNINLVSKKGEGGNDAWMRDTKVAVLYLMLAYSKPMLNWIWKSHLNQESEQATWIVLMMTASCPLTKIQFKPSSRIYCSLVGFFHIQSITQHIYNQHHLPLAIGGGGGANKKW